MREITELEQKYYVIKKDDAFKYLNCVEASYLIQILHIINYGRANDNKILNNYLVLNLDDKINIPYLIKRLVSHPLIKTVYDIRLFLINAILNKR